ncbi:hypothetical protein DAMNIGENAA_24350 [Desulforhabdus amnigena]|uniref:Uncharacterized protein n=1 Tax=Desulforhabdus amnigena TaxID=40218 RepID=A0A9W6FUB2_9BACT|nr:hypothetical protein DAMNIGENAA_24350 [Desulforhabdus amnigena]
MGHSIFITQKYDCTLTKDVCCEPFKRPVLLSQAYKKLSAVKAGSGLVYQETYDEIKRERGSKLPPANSRKFCASFD